MAATQLEIQLGYFLTPPKISSDIKAHAVRVFNSARALISLSVELESRSQFLTHAPLWALRALVDATGIIIAILHSSCAPGIPDRDADMLIRQACGAILRCSVRDTDLAHRVSVVMETYWSVRHLVPSMGAAPGARTERLVAGVTFWFLRRFHTGLQAAQSKTDRVNKALEMTRRLPNCLCVRGCGLTNAESNKHPPPSAADMANGQAQGVQMASDPIQDVDWSMFMDDFGWTGDESVLLGLP